ncbi:hypothetical protein FKB34_02880 [Glycocaulis profundi]|nr:hypothetical protein FKB34_02880 [Glycocaulis profundi]
MTVHVAAGGEPVIEARINGEPVRLLLALEAPRFVMMNGGAADRLGLRANPVLSQGVSIDMAGNHVRGRTGRATISTSSDEFRQRVIWFPDLELTDAADGLIGPAAFRNLERLTITFEGGSEAVSEHVFAGRRGMEWTGEATVSGLEMRVGFSLLQPSEIGTGHHRRLERAGLIAAADGSLGLEPVGFIGRMLAYRHENSGLAPGGIAPETFIRFARRQEVAAEGRRADDGVERIVVSGEDASPDRRVSLTLGRETLSQCAEIAFDYRTDAITVRCPGG